MNDNGVVKDEPKVVSKFIPIGIMMPADEQPAESVQKKRLDQWKPWVCSNDLDYRNMVDYLGMEDDAMKTIIVCDIETNNDQWSDEKPKFDFFKDDPIQIAYSVYRGHQKMMEKEILLSTPNLFPHIEKFTGITKQMLNEKGVPHKVAATAWKNVFRIFSPYAVVGHNLIAFDWPMLTNWLLRTLAEENFILPVVPTLSDTMKRGSLWLNGTNGKWPKLKDLTCALGIEVDETKLHNALYDIELCAQCHFALEEKGF